MKLNKNQIEKIRKLYKTGKYTQKEIAEIFGIAQSTVLYYVNDKYRKKTIERVKKYSHEKYKKGMAWTQTHKEDYRNYIRNYMFNRYHTDKEFRKKMIESNKKVSKRWREKNMDKYRNYMKNYMRDYKKHGGNKKGILKVIKDFIMLR